MKTTKRNIAITSLLLVGSMLLAACGADATPTTAPAATATTGQAAAAATATPAAAAPTNTAGASTSGDTSKGTIKIVSSLPRTGLSKPQTDDIVAGFHIALDEHNGAAGGYKIDYQDLDDATAQTGKWDAATESGNAAKAVDDADIMVYLGTFNSGAAKISIPILNKAGLAMISPANTAPELTKKGFDDATLNTLYDPSKPHNYFRVVVADDVQGAAAASWAIELGFKKAYVINDQEVYGKGVATVFANSFKANGGTVIANEGIEKSQPDYKSLMAKVKDSGADLLYFGGLVDDGGPQIAKDLKAVAPTVQFMGPDGILTQAQIDAAGAAVSEGNLGTVAGKSVPDLPAKGAQFYQKFNAKFGRDPDPYAIFGYESMNVALDAINKAGTKDRAAILAAIASTKDYQGALGTWSFDANGDTTLTDIKGNKVVGGKWVFQKYVKPTK
jgi:branched-chain amino acid transport system substrate-binding protein